MPEVYEVIRKARTALIFVNTRFQAEFAFQELWRLNEDSLPIALHHGSLAAEQRRKVEAAMTRGELRAVVCTSTLDLGVDWGDVDLVIQLASPKGAARMVQRIGRANHRLDEPSHALFVPANRFEMLECQAAREAIAENALDSEPERVGALDVLAQHIMGCACSEPFDLLALYEEVRRAGPYRALIWEDFEAVVDFVATGGYALRAYDRFARIVKGRDGLWKVRNAEMALRHRMNIGAIVSPAVLSVRLASRRVSCARSQDRRGRGGLSGRPGAGRHLRLRRPVWCLVGQVGMDVLVTPAPGEDAKMPSWGGSKFALSTFLASRVARDDVRRPPLGGIAERCAGMAGDPARPVGDSRPGRDAAGDLPARPSPFPGLLSVRRAPRPYDPGHAVDPPARAPGRGSARLRVQRLRPGGVGA